MVNIRFKTSKAREKAWDKAGRCQPLIDMGGLRKAHWKGEKTLSFPYVESKRILKRCKLI